MVIVSGKPAPNYVNAFYIGLLLHNLQVNISP